MLEEYKKDKKFLKIVNKIGLNCEIIQELMEELKEKFPVPNGFEYDFNLKENSLRIIKKK